MQTDLPNSYYLDNVLTLFDHVERVYPDLLEPGQRDFLSTFAALGESARKLYIRLLNRNRNWFRRNKLNYTEIMSVDDAIIELEQARCLQVNGDIEADVLLGLFTLAELLDLDTQAKAMHKLGRSELETRLLEPGRLNLIEKLKTRDKLLKILRKDEYLICQMLFFGNLNQSMTDFVLRDLGMVRFEQYAIDASRRPYRNRHQIRQHWDLHRLEMAIETENIDDTAILLEYENRMPAEVHPQAPAYRKNERLRYRIARQIERNGDLAEALAIYCKGTLPPNRERIARIYERQHNHRASLSMCLTIAGAPADETEAQFAAEFGTRLMRKYKLETESAKTLRPVSHQPEVIDLELEHQQSVEIAVAENYTRQDPAERCYYLENNLFTGVLGLLLWEVVFAALPGVFFNPFQYRPSDFYAPDFCIRRAPLIDQLWGLACDNNRIEQVVLERWHAKNGIMNPLVNWQGLNLEVIHLALQRIDYAHWRAIFDRILGDLRNNRAGFPDLVHFPAGGGYNLIEVKGPGDHLQKNQQRWMQYFHQHQIPHQLVRVNWRED